MANAIAPSIVEAQRMEEGVIVTFTNGQSAIYSSSLLYSMLSQAEIVTNTESLEDATEP